MNKSPILTRRIRPLRYEQMIAYDLIMAAINDGEKSMAVQAPCGFGKTLLAVHIVNYYISRRKRVCFVVPLLTLIDQVVEVFGFEGFAESIGVIQGHHPLTDYRKPLQIASRDTLTRRKLPEIDVLIIDECHMMTKAFAKLIKAMPNVVVIGLSATPWTKGLGKIFAKLIIAETTQGLIDKGLLARFIVYAPSPEPDLKHVKTIAGDYNQEELSDACNTLKLVADIVETWILRGENRPTLCFGVDRSHAKHICQRFIEAGVKAEFIDCFTSDFDRRSILERFRTGKTKILCNVSVLTTGVDTPWASCLIDAHPTRSETLYIQTIGRILRTHPSKSHALIFDHAGNSLRLGLVTDIHHKELCDGSLANEKARKNNDKQTPLPRLCEACKAVVPQQMDNCPECGALKVKITGVKHVDGELVEFGLKHKPLSKGPSIEDMERFHGELLQLAAEKGRRHGWAAHQFLARFGIWPNHPRIKHAVPRAPSLSTINFVRSRAIAWAKAQQRG